MQGSFQTKQHTLVDFERYTDWASSGLKLGGCGSSGLTKTYRDDAANASMIIDGPGTSVFIHYETHKLLDYRFLIVPIRLSTLQGLDKGLYLKPKRRAQM